jgi:hypothetical protein
MSRSTNRARKRARVADKRRKDLAFLDHMRGAEMGATGTHAALSVKAVENLARTHATVSATFAAKPSPKILPLTPLETRCPAPTPKTLWEAAMGKPETPPKPVKAPHVPNLRTRVYTSIKAAELPQDVRDCVKYITWGAAPRMWEHVGSMTRDGARLDVFARKHGASVRYSTTPA